MMNEWFKKNVLFKSFFDSPFYFIDFFLLDTVRVVLPFKDQTAANVKRQCETFVPISLCR